MPRCGSTTRGMLQSLDDPHSQTVQPGQRWRPSANRDRSRPSRSSLLEHHLRDPASKGKALNAMKPDPARTSAIGRPMLHHPSGGPGSGNDVLASGLISRYLDGPRPSCCGGKTPRNKCKTDRGTGASCLDFCRACANALVGGLELTAVHGSSRWGPIFVSLSFLCAKIVTGRGGGGEPGPGSLLERALGVDSQEACLS